MEKHPPTPRTRAEHDRLVEKVTALKQTVDELRDRNETLEAERRNLLKENRRLRRKLTHIRLLDGFEDTIDTIETELGQLPPAPPPAEQLYQLLPTSFSFAEFFSLAEGTDLNTDGARKCLLHFLAKDLIVQEGSRLAKEAKTFQETNGTDRAWPRRA